METCIFTFEVYFYIIRPKEKATKPNKYRQSMEGVKFII